MRVTTLLLGLALTPWFVVAEERIAEIRQGTNLTLALAPQGDTLVVGLLGQLWSLPATGGGAVPLTPSGEQVRNPRYSPDGRRVVYQRLIGSQWDIWLHDLTTGEQRALTSSPFNEREPDFANDGRTVVFAANRTGSYCLWSIAVDGGVEAQLTDEPGRASFPTVSAEGLVAYVHERRPREWSIRVLGRDGANAIVHSSSRPLASPSWRPGAGVLVFSEQESAGGSRLWLLFGEPRVLKPLTNAEDVFGTRPAWLSGAEFIYAADGQLWRREIASPVRQPIHLFAASIVQLARPPTGSLRLDERNERSAIGVNNVAESRDSRRATFTALQDVWLAERGRVQRLTDDGFVDRDPAFSPDGESVVFSSERTGQFELWRLTLADRRLTQLTFGALQPRQPAFRPDGQQLAYLAAESYEPWATARLEVLDWPSGGQRTVATDLVHAVAPMWSSDGRVLTVQATSGKTSSETPRNLTVEVTTPLSIGAAASGASEEVTQALRAVRWQPPPPPADYVVEVGRLFDGVSGAYRRHVDLHVRGGRIAAIVGRGVLPVSGDVIDARDATVIPGLVDVHVHEIPLSGERLGRTWLAYGVTTIHELAHNPTEALERAETWASGRAPGPRVLVTPAGTADTTGTPSTLPLDGTTQGFAHSLPRQAADLGVPPDLPDAYPARLRFEPLPPAALELEVSPSWATYQDGVSRLVASGTTFVPGLAALAGMGHSARGPAGARNRATAYRTLFSPAEQSAWEQSAGLENEVSMLAGTIARLVRAGGRVAIGSEAPALPFGLGFHLELAALARAGIAADQVLRMATIGGALALGLEGQIGTLEQGKLADFVVLDGDPLLEIGATLDIVAVAKGGTWYDRQALLRGP